MPSKSKTKGSAFENEFARNLNKIYHTTEFARAPLSGAFMGRSNAAKRSGIAQAAQDTLRGDLITPADFPFVIECKCYAEAPLFHKIMEGAEKHIDKWILEVEFDAEQANKLPMLVFKRSRVGTFVVVPFKVLSGQQVSHMMVYGKYIIVSLDVFNSMAPKLWTRK